MLGKEILLATTYLDNKAARQIQRQKAKNERMIKGRKKKDLWKVRGGLWDLGATFVGRGNMICFISSKQDVIYEIRSCFALLWGQGESHRWGLFLFFVVVAKLLLFQCLSLTMQLKVVRVLLLILKAKTLRVFLWKTVSTGVCFYAVIIKCMCVCVCECGHLAFNRPRKWFVSQWQYKGKWV